MLFVDGVRVGAARSLYIFYTWHVAWQSWSYGRNVFPDIKQCTYHLPEKCWHLTVSAIMPLRRGLQRLPLQLFSFRTNRAIVRSQSLIPSNHFSQDATNVGNLEDTMTISLK